MKKRNVIVGAMAMGFVLAPLSAFAGWASRTSGDTGSTGVTAAAINRVPPLGENYKFPTKADRVQGRPSFQAFANSPYATETPPSVVTTPATTDPVYFDKATGSSRFWR
jgi:hypothetical protein